MLNRKWKYCQIVYVADSLEYVMDVYKTNHLWFVLKEQYEKWLPALFHKLLYGKEQASRIHIFTLKNNEKVHLAPDEIIYFERVRRTTYIYTPWGIYETTEKLDSIQEKLSSMYFIRCHKSFLVYLPAVHIYKEHRFFMKNGTQISISRTYGKTVKQKYMNWIKMQTK